MNTNKITRRDFLKVSAVSGVGMLLAIYLPGCADEVEESQAPSSQESVDTETTVAEADFTVTPNIYASIDNLGQVTVTAFRSEMGQGVRTAIAMILAEELDASWSSVKIEQAPANPQYGDQVTGGSQSISRHFDIIRRAGATARQMLIDAAAQVWGLSSENCSTSEGFVYRQDTEEKLSYGELVEIAADLPSPNPFSVPLKDPQEFKIIGSDIGHYDAKKIIAGAAQYTSDLVLPDMQYAVVARCPTFGGKVLSYNDKDARQVSGVIDIIEINTGIAVLAEHTWAAIQGRRALEITWDEGNNKEESSQTIYENLLSNVGEPQNDPETGEMQANYFIPFQAHATMEPMVCVVDFQADHCEIWAPSQNPQDAKRVARNVAQLPNDSISVHTPLIGGGFGRRLQSDFVNEAVQISKTVEKPIKLIWTREDDIQHDFYHPLSLTRAISNSSNPGRVRANPREYSGGIPTGAWRSVGNFTEAFAHESMIDEVAVFLNKDPYQIRTESLSGRGKAVVELAATKAGWQDPLPEGWGRGMAYHATFGVTHVAHVAEVSIGESGAIKVERVVSAVDCGIAINPDNIKAQIEGGIVFGLTATLKAKIDVENGRVKQSNFHDYPLLQIDEMPAVEVYIIENDTAPTGIGEMGVPPIAPAVANAIFAATKKRIRHIPIMPEDITN
jgi:isoquinoline 1-oxidoreductase beta subunit